MTTWSYGSAADLGLTGMRRRCSAARESGLFSSAARWGWLVTVKGLLTSWNHLEIQGLEHIPRQPPFVLVANHTSHLDAAVLACILPRCWRDQVSPLAAGDYFFSSPPMAGFAASVLNALPVWRHRRGGHSHELGDLRDRLTRQRAIYIVFPEGSRSRDGHLGPFKPGFAALVAGTSIPVVPCHLEGMHAALPPGALFLRPGRIGVSIGRPMTFESVPNHVAGWRSIAPAVQKATQALAAPG